MSSSNSAPDVFLLPVGGHRYALYCEPADDDTIVDADDAPGIFSRLRARFREMLAEAERERASGRREAGAGDSRLTTARRRVMRWVAERIAEQRLLWRLRHTDQAVLQHPDDLDGERAKTLLRQMLKGDADRHGRWLIVHGLLFVGSGVFFFVPGPNLVAYYFAFRLVGHYFSRRGAQRGLASVQWETRSASALTALRQVVALPAAQRHARLQDLARELRLDHLVAFVERTAVATG